MKANKLPSIKTYVMVLGESSGKYILYGDESTLPAEIIKAYPYTQDLHIQITKIKEVPYTGTKGSRKFELDLSAYNITYVHHVYISTLEEYNNPTSFILTKRLSSSSSHRIIK